MNPANIAFSTKAGWAQATNFKWRQIGLQHLRLVMSRNFITVWENDRKLCSCAFTQNPKFAGPLPWSTAYLYLQQSNQCNYPVREVSFGNIAIQHIQLQPDDAALPFAVAIDTRPVLTVQPAIISTPPPATPDVPFEEHFAAGQLDWTRWTLTRKNDFHESTMTIVGTNETDRRLSLRADTTGTDNKTVKYHGVRTVNPVLDIRHPTEVKFDLDWPAQGNCYNMSAGVFICPTATSGTPEDEPDWIKVNYLGVFPGGTARIAITLRKNGSQQEQVLFDDGWGEAYAKNTAFPGRSIGKQHIRCILSQQSITVWENGTLLCSYDFSQHAPTAAPLAWSTAYLYLQQSSHASYKARAVYFANIEVRQQ